ncbi:MAG: multidrug effflux MFS transporter [Pseudomonadota bacterium]
MRQSDPGGPAAPPSGGARVLPDAADREAGRAPLALMLALALMTSMVALTIDAVLPALDAIDRDLGFADPNDRHLVVMVVFAGLAAAQLVVGPLADALGRLPVAMGGYAVFLVGTALAGLAESEGALLAGRFLQGLGAAGPRVIGVTVVRDLYQGTAMARVSSLVNTIFIAVPMLAPLMGQGIEALGGWRAIFLAYAVIAVASLVVYWAVVGETLPAARRRPLSPGAVWRGYLTVLTNRRAMTCTAITACVFGGFTAYLATAQQVFEELYGLGHRFPLVFALMAGFFAAASFANGRLVMRFGMRRLATVAMALMTGAGALGAVVAAGTGGVPPLWAFVLLLAPLLMAVAVLFANVIALAVEPLGHVAGTATSVVLATATLVAAALGSVIASFHDATVLPLFAGFAGLGLVACLLFAWLGRVEARGGS